ncbi:MAG: alpha-1,4-glucan--maltose-1-phosphate maltosyltransferase [Vicinamibacterales bacterium]
MYRPAGLPAAAGVPPRVVIERVEPEIDAGRFPVKRTIGEPVDVSADIFADAHDRIAAVVRYRHLPPGSGSQPGGWMESPLQDLGYDRWRGSFTVESRGRYEYTLVAWIDHFGTLVDDLSKKFAAGQRIDLDLEETALLVLEAAERIRSNRPAEALFAGAATDLSRWLTDVASQLRGPMDVSSRVAVAMSALLRRVMLRHASRKAPSVYEPILHVVVERERARYGAWYEMFPRSAGADPERSGTFAEAAARLQEVAAMGFDVVYLPPIHPIGRRFRKGRNNALVAGPRDPGSPWAVGGPEGGHTAVEPGLGTIADFDRFVAAANRAGLEVALDLAYQASPDHPFVREHPEWFRHRPDGSIRYAENPPKRYQDIFPFDFESRDWHSLWRALADVALFWIRHGVRIFRVDNPHTKPFRFWEWLIHTVRSRHDDVVFLAEAFTRPAVMRHLAKLGFSQSYTYFTWRNTKRELTEYFNELTTTAVREYMRPNLFTNTPDILHEYLQRGGRPAFQVRLLLAATLGANYGIYSGFELLENRAVPGTEEYEHSEKYEFRKRDWNRPGNIKELVATVNRIRRENAALHYDTGLRFHETDNGELIAYSKTSPRGGNRLFMVVNLDPFHMQHGWVRVPASDWSLSGRAYRMHDLVTDERYEWHGEWNYIRLDPTFRVGHILRLEA